MLVEGDGESTSMIRSPLISVFGNSRVTGSGSSPSGHHDQSQKSISMRTAAIPLPSHSRTNGLGWAMAGSRRKRSAIRPGPLEGPDVVPHRSDHCLAVRLHRSGERDSDVVALRPRINARVVHLLDRRQTDVQVVDVIL